MPVVPYKSLTEKRTSKARAQETNNESACTWNERTYIKLKLILSPPGLSVPSLKINCVSRRFRLVLLLLHCSTPQILMSSMSFHVHALRLFVSCARAFFSKAFVWRNAHIPAH